MKFFLWNLSQVIDNHCRIVTALLNFWKTSTHHRLITDLSYFHRRIADSSSTHHNRKNTRLIIVRRVIICYVNRHSLPQFISTDRREIYEGVFDFISANNSAVTWQNIEKTENSLQLQLFRSKNWYKLYRGNI